MAQHRILFVHQNYPSQFRHLAPALAQRGWQVRALRQGAGSGQQPLPQQLEVGAFYWTVLTPDIVNLGREEQGSVSV